MNIQHTEKDTKGSFYIQKNGSKVAEMTYSKAGATRIIIDHTEVGDAYRGQGLGEKLVETAVQYAREHELSILPLCPFAKSVFEKKEDWNDVLN